MLLEHVNDVGEAINFCQQQGEDELWEDLITSCLAKPKLVAPLLQDIGAHVDPIKVVKRIPYGMKIDGLREKLIKIISDYHLQMSLREGCEHILKSDVVSLGRKLNRAQRRAIRIDGKSRCGLTGAPLVEGENMLLRPYPGVVAFYGGRAYQEEALVGLCLSDAPQTASELGKSKVVSSSGGPSGQSAGKANLGGDAAAAARVIMQRGFSVDGRRFVRTQT